MRYLMMLALAMAALPAACSDGHDATLPGNAQDTQPFSGIGDDEIIRLAGTEPFWGGTLEGESLTYSTPENIEGQQLSVSRFAGRGGLSFSGDLDGMPLDLMVTPGACSDGMSDRTYPFTVTLQIGEELRTGCGWSDKQPFEGDPQP